MKKMIAISIMASFIMLMTACSAKIVNERNPNAIETTAEISSEATGTWEFIYDGYLNRYSSLNALLLLTPELSDKEKNEILVKAGPNDDGFNERYVTLLMDKMPIYSYENRLVPLSFSKIKFDEQIRGDQSNPFWMYQFDVGGLPYIALSPPNSGSAIEIIDRENRCTYLCSDSDIYRINANTLEIEKISTDTFNGKTRNEITTELNSKSGNNGRYLFWITEPFLSPNGKYLAYTSNKNLEQSEMLIYLLDTGGKGEIALTNEPVADRIIGWLDDNTLLCTHDKEKGNTLLLIDREGKSKEIYTFDRSIFTVGLGKDKLIYQEENNIKTVNAMTIDPQTGAIKAENYEMTGESRLRGSCLNQDASRFGMLVSNDPYSLVTFLEIVNLKTGGHEVIDDLPEGVDSILEFRWVDNESVLMVTMRFDEKETIYQTWVYKVK